VGRGPGAGGPPGAWAGPNLASARGLVRSSGTAGDTVRVWTGPRTAPYATHVVRVLRDIGYRPRLRRFRTDEAYYVAINGGGRPQVGFDGWIADDPRPEDFIEPLVGCGRRELNAIRSRYCNRSLDRAIARAGRLPGVPDPVVWSRIERRIVAAAPIVPLLNRRTIAIAAPRVGNLVLHPNVGVLLDRVWVR
jgi:peptide/nickel transport system substrate-binding protein